MKHNAIVRIILFSVGIVALLGVLLASLFLNIYIADGRVITDQIAATEHPQQMFSQGNYSKDIRNIKIDWAVGNITVYSDATATDITVTETSDVDCKYETVIKQSGQTLKIEYCKDSVQLPSLGITADVSKDLVIVVPADWNCSSLEIDTASADVSVDGITIGEFDFDGASGVCKITNCDVTELDLDTASGDVTFTGTLDILECDAASASCSITAWNIPSSIKMDAASGDLELILPEDAGFTCKMETMSGSFNSDFQVDSSSGNYVHGDGSCKINLNAMSGEVCIYKDVSHHSGHHSE